MKLKIRYFAFVGLMLLICMTSVCIQKKSILSVTTKYDKPHYASLAAISSGPRSEFRELDERHWIPSDKYFVYFKEYYLPRDTTQFIVPPPPANSSLQTRAELDYLIKLQNTRTAEDKQLVMDIENNQYNTSDIETQTPEMRKPLFYLGKSIPWFTPENLPLTSLLLAKAEVEVNWYINAYKMKFKRPRPWIIDQDVHKVTKLNFYSASYPSGHAAFAFSEAFILMKVAPEYKNLFLKDAINFAWSRELGGIHYPSDTRTSRKFAMEYVEKLFTESKAFKSDFDNAREEWKAVSKQQGRTQKKPG